MLGLIGAHALVLALIGMAALAVGRAALQRSATEEGGDFVVVAPWEWRLLRCGIGSAVVGGWGGWVLFAHQPESLWTLAGCACAATGAAAAVFIAADDYRHHHVDLDACALCFGAAVLCAWLRGGAEAAGCAAVVAIGAGSFGVAYHHATSWSETLQHGDGEWLLFAVAGAWVGTGAFSWQVLAVVATIAHYAMGARVRAVPMAPALVIGVVVSLIAGR